MKTAVLLMSYGSPRNIDEVEPYYTDIRGGRAPSPEALKDLVDRYQAVGGPSKLNELTFGQAGALGAELERRDPGGFTVFVGMKHWHPFIAETVNEIGRGDFSNLIGLVLAPHFSKKSIGEYEQLIDEALWANSPEKRGGSGGFDGPQRGDSGAEPTNPPEKRGGSGGFDGPQRGDSGAEPTNPPEKRMVQQWYDEPAFVDFVSDNLKESLSGWDLGDVATRVFFTAHSIPSRIVAEGDPYADQLADSAKIYADAAGISNFSIGWQSASSTREPWLGPDILDVLKDFKQGGGERALVAPVGFVSDHLEVTYDVDIECMDLARQIDLEVRRISSPNDNPRFVSALADVVMRYADQ